MAARSPIRFAWLLFAFLCLDALFATPLSIAQSGIQITASRVWPARDYTRITLESRTPIRHNLFSVKDPERLVLDLEG
ncbi:MAG TPA: AMIN domain-containing protein, partial [Burkholderiales bacterium]|nr:AMIN domain-containing protein [Burkholderiales bacterium]